jgi:hypothetical protein
MLKTWNNLVRHTVVLLLLTLFAVPCLACEDAVGRWLCHQSHDAFQAPHILTTTCGRSVRETAHNHAAPCHCLSDTAKVRSDRSPTTQIIPESSPAPLLVTLPEPTPFCVARYKRHFNLPPLLVHPAAAGRAPPAV